MHAAISPLPANTDSIRFVSSGSIREIPLCGISDHADYVLRLRNPERPPHSRTGQAMRALDERTRDKRIRGMALSGIQGKLMGPLVSNVEPHSVGELYRMPKTEDRRSATLATPHVNARPPVARVRGRAIVQSVSRPMCSTVNFHRADNPNYPRYSFGELDGTFEKRLSSGGIHAGVTYPCRLTPTANAGGLRTVQYQRSAKPNASLRPPMQKLLTTHPLQSLNLQPLEPSRLPPKNPLRFRI